MVMGFIGFIQGIVMQGIGLMGRVMVLECTHVQIGAVGEFKCGVKQ